MRLAALLICTLFLRSAFASGPLHLAPQKDWLEVPLGSDATGQLAVADVNGDGKADLVFYNTAKGTAWVALSNGHGFAAPTLWAYGLPKATPTLQFMVADVNGDRRADFVAFVHGDGQASGSANVYVALSTGSHFQYGANPVWNSGFCITEQVCKLADVNGDGKADLIAFTPRFGLVWVSLSNGAGFGANAVWNRYFCLLNEICEMGDVAGSGKFGPLLFKPHAPPGQKGNVLLSPSNGSAFGAVSYGHGYFCIDQERCLVGDFNGDHRTDIALVKGFGAPTLEVLVSLSNGQHFLNANPFSWGNPINSKHDTAFGSFFVGDFDGDGKADLLQTDTRSVASGHGGWTNTGALYWVYLTTDRPTPTPPPTGTRPPAAGVKQVDIYNCDSNQDRLYYWTRDLTAGTQSSQGPIDAMYSESGYCPDPNDHPVSLSFVTGHTYQVIAVDPNAIACEGQNDPDVVACRRDDVTVVGNSSGQVARWIIPSR